MSSPSDLASDSDSIRSTDARFVTRLAPLLSLIKSLPRKQSIQDPETDFHSDTTDSDFSDEESESDIRGGRDEHQANKKQVPSVLLKQLRSAEEGVELIKGVWIRLTEEASSRNDDGEDEDETKLENSRLTISFSGPDLHQSARDLSKRNLDTKSALDDLHRLVQAVPHIPVDIVYQAEPHSSSRSRPDKKTRGRKKTSPSSTIALTKLFKPKYHQTLLSAVGGEYLPEHVPKAWVETLINKPFSPDPKLQAKMVERQVQMLYEILKIIQPSRISFDLALSGGQIPGHAKYWNNGGSSDSESSINLSEEENLKNSSVDKLMDHNLDNDKILLPLGILPFILAGNRYFSAPISKSNSSSHHPSLPFLAIGPEIPISISPGMNLPGWFAFSKWIPSKLVIHHWAIAKTGKEKNKLGRREKLSFEGGKSLPRVIWEEEFGFLDMMRGSEDEKVDDEDEDEQQRNDGTDFILLVQTDAQAEDFRNEIEELASAGVGMSRLQSLLGRSKNGSERRNGFAKLDVLQRKVFYIASDGRGEGEAMPVWNGKHDPLRDWHAACTCGKEHRGDKTVESEAEDSGADRKAKPKRRWFQRDKRKVDVARRQPSKKPIREDGSGTDSQNDSDSEQSSEVR